MLTQYYANLVVGNLLRTQTTPSIPTTYWIGASTTEPTYAGTGATEPSTTGTGYARIKLDSLSVPSDGLVANELELAFPESTSSWGTITYICFYDAQTGGNLLAYSKLNESRLTYSGSIFRFKASDIGVKVSG